VAVVVPIISQFDSRGISKAIADFKKLEGAGQKTTYGLRTLDKGMTTLAKNFAKVAAVGLGATAVIGKSLVDAGSNLEESMSKVNVVFGESSKAVVDFANKAAVNLGISKTAALEAAGTYGNLFQAFGIGQAPAQEMSTTLVQLASDLASFNNVNVDDALLALRSGLSGETEPLKKFGIALNDVRLKEEAMALGLIKSTSGTLPAAIKAQAAYSLIMKDSALAQGDFARTSDGVANTQRTLQATFQDIKAELGTALLPTYKALLGFVQDQVMPRFKEFAQIVGEDGVSGALKYLGTTFLEITSSGNGVVDLLLALGTAFAIIKGITIAATISQNLFNVALFSNPIGIVVAAIIAFGVAVVAAYLRFEGFRKVVNTVVNAIIGYFEFLINGWIKIINVIIMGINLLIRGANLFGAGLPTIAHISEVSFGRIGDAADKAKSKVQALMEVNDKYNGKVVSKKGTKEEETPPIIPTGGGGGVVETAKEKLKKYLDVLKGVSQAERSRRDAGEKVSEMLKAQTLATDNVRKAQEVFNKVTKGYGRDSAEASKQVAEVAKAQRDLVRANFSVQDSVEKVKEAEERLKALREGPSQKTVEDADIALQKKKFGLEEAVFAVGEAEQDLADIRLDPEASAQAIREAEIRLAEAKFDVRDANFAIATAEEELKKLRESTPTAQDIEDAERELTLAKLDAEEATIAQQTATTNLTNEEALLTEIIYGAKEGSEAYSEALKDLEKAKLEAEEASKSYRDALEDENDAVLKLIESEKELAELRKKTPTAIVNKAVAAMTPTYLPQSSGGVTTLSAEMRDALDARRNAFGVTAFASGGIVTRPTLGLVGEAGAEAIIPLNNLGGLGTTINIEVNAGLGTDGSAVGDAIVDALKRYQRRNGSVPITVS
jgi:hypothetical protein